MEDFINGGRSILFALSVQHCPTTDGVLTRPHPFSRGVKNHPMPQISTRTPVGALRIESSDF